MKTMIYGFAAMMLILAGQVVVDVAYAKTYGGYRSFSRPSYSRPSYSRPSYSIPRTNFSKSRAERPAPAPVVKPLNPVAKPLQQKPPAVVQRHAQQTRTVEHTRTVESSPSWWQWMMPVWIYSAFTGESNKPAPGATCSDAERKLNKCPTTTK